MLCRDDGLSLVLVRWVSVSARLARLPSTVVVIGVAGIAPRAIALTFMALMQIASITDAKSGNISVAPQEMLARLFADGKAFPAFQRRALAFRAIWDRAAIKPHVVAAVDYAKIFITHDLSLCISKPDKHDKLYIIISSDFYKVKVIAEIPSHIRARPAQADDDIDTSHLRRNRHRGAHSIDALGTASR